MHMADFSCSVSGTETRTHKTPEEMEIFVVGVYELGGITVVAFQSFSCFSDEDTQMPLNFQTVAYIAKYTNLWLSRQHRVHTLN